MGVGVKNVDAGIKILLSVYKPVPTGKDADVKFDMIPNGGRQTTVQSIPDVSRGGVKKPGDASPLSKPSVSLNIEPN